MNSAVTNPADLAFPVAVGPRSFATLDQDGVAFCGPGDAVPRIARIPGRAVLRIGPTGSGSGVWAVVAERTGGAERRLLVRVEPPSASPPK